MIKQQQQKHHHRTEAKNKILQHCFSSGLPACLKGESLQWAIPALTLDSGSQTNHQFPIAHTQLEPRSHFSGEEKQEQEIITTLKIPWRESKDATALGSLGQSCPHTFSLWGREDLVLAGEPGKVLTPCQLHPPVLQADLKSVLWLMRHLEEHREDLHACHPSLWGQHPTEAEELERDQFPEVAKVQK